MDISRIDSPVVPPVRTDPVTPVNSDAVAPLTTANSVVAASSIVEFSPLAQLLAVTVIFQTKQGQSVTPTSTGNTSTFSFQQLIDAANNFINAFNAFQNTINGSYATSFEVAFDKALLAALQIENNQSDTKPVQSSIDNLAQLGIHFQGAANPLNPNFFQFNLTALEQAYANSPGQTTALLNNVFQGLSTVEQQLLLAQTTQTQNQNLMTQMAALVTPANMNAPIAGGASGATPAAAVVMAATAAEAGNAPVVTGNFATTAAASVGTNSTANAVAAANTAAAATTATPATTGTLVPFDPVTGGPLIAQAVAAYRVIENITPPPSSLLIPLPTVETVPDIIETTRVEPIGPNTPKGQAPRVKQ